MSLNTQQKADNGRVEEGNYPARIVRILGLGKQKQTDHITGEFKKYDDGNFMIKPEVWIDFEFPTETITIGGVDRPRWLGKSYTISTHEKSNMYGLMKAAGLNTNNGDMAELINKPLAVTVGTTSGGNAKVTSVNEVMTGVVVPDLQNEPVVFDSGIPDRAVFDSLPKFLKEKIGGAEDAVKGTYPDADSLVNGVGGDFDPDFDDAIPQ